VRVSAIIPLVIIIYLSACFFVFSPLFCDIKPLREFYIEERGCVLFLLFVLDDDLKRDTMEIAMGKKQRV